MYYLPTSLIMISLSVAIFYFTIKNRQEKREKHNFINEMLVGFLFLLSGLIFPFLFQSHSENLPQSSLDFLWLTTSIILFIETLVWSSLLGWNSIKSKRHPEYKESRNYDEFCEKFRSEWKYNFKKDVERKFLHLLPVVVIFVFWTLGMILEGVGVLALWGLDTYSFALWLIVTVGFGFCVMFVFADLARLNAFHVIPEWAIKWYCKSMTDKELDTYISSAPLVLSFVPFIFAPFPLFAAVALITAVADAAASLVGKRYGKHRFNENSKKTIEGYIAGTSMTFLIVIIVTGIYHPWMAVNIGVVMAMASIAAILFFLIDALAENITDNILNPLLTGTGMLSVLSISIFLL